MTSDVLKGFRAHVLAPAPQIETVENAIAPLVAHLNSYFYESKSGFENRRIVGSFLRRTAVPFQSPVDILYVLPASLQRYIGRNHQDAEIRIYDLFNQIFRSSAWSINSEEVFGTIIVECDPPYKVRIWPVFEVGFEQYQTLQTSRLGRNGPFRPFVLERHFSAHNESTGQNLLILCKSIRLWAYQNQVPISGYLIDCLATQFISTSPYRNFSHHYQDCLLRDFFLYLSHIEPQQDCWEIYGTQELVYRSGFFERQAEDAYHAVERIISNSLIRHDDEVRAVMRNLVGLDRV